MAKITPSLEDYLEEIYLIEETKKIVRVTDIAAGLNISKPSVNRALKMLREMDFIHQEKYGDVELTEEGRKKAASVMVRHRLLRRFLQEVLGVSPETAEKDACMMEHVVSQETMERLVQFVEEHKVP